MSLLRWWTKQWMKKSKFLSSTSTPRNSLMINLLIHLLPFKMTLRNFRTRDWRRINRAITIWLFKRTQHQLCNITIKLATFPVKSRTVRFSLCWQIKCKTQIEWIKVLQSTTSQWLSWVTWTVNSRSMSSILVRIRFLRDQLKKWRKLGFQWELFSRKSRTSCNRVPTKTSLRT